jgi:hypothetical protein
MEKAAAVGIAAALPRAEAAIEAGEWLTPDAKRPVTPEPPRSDAQSQQRNNADTDYQHRKRNGIVIEPMPALHTHDASPYQPATLSRSSAGRRSRGRAFTLFSRAPNPFGSIFACIGWQKSPGILRHAARPLQLVICTIDF